MKNKRRLKRTAFGTMLLTSTVLLFMLAGTSLALTNPVFIHGYASDGSPDPQTQITLRDACGTAISSGSGLQAAFSAKETCGACHDGIMLDGNGDPLLSYNEIERHAYHAQMSANEFVGWNTYNANAVGLFSKFRKSGTPKGKSWVQSLGHFGKW